MSNNNINNMNGDNRSPINNNRRNSIRSNKNSTFDMFNINVKDATKSVDKIFSYSESRLKKFTTDQKKSYQKLYNDLSKMNKSYNNDIIKKSDIATKTIISNTIKSYSNMYDILRKKNSLYLKDLISSNKNAYKEISKVWSNDPSSSSTNNVVSNSSISESNNNFTNTIFKNNIFNKSIFNNVIFDKVSINTDQFDGIEDKLSKIANNTDDNSNNSNSNNAKDNKSNSNGSSVNNFFSKATNVLSSNITSTLKSMVDDNQRTYEIIARNSNMTSRKEIDNYMHNFREDTREKYGSEAFSNEELNKALSDSISKGLTGENATTMAMNNLVMNKILPAIDTNTAEFVNLSMNLSDANMKNLTNSMSILKESQSGNRLIESGVINSLVSDIEPLLTSIDFNTGGSSNLSQEYMSVMQSLVANNNFSPQEAYAQVKHMMDIDKDYSRAFENGSVTDILYATEAGIKGNDKITSYINSANVTASMASNTNGNVGSAFAGNALGTWTSGGIQTKDSNKQSILDESATRDIFNQYLSDTSAYEDAVNELNRYNNASTNFQNNIESNLEDIANLQDDYPKQMVEQLGDIVNLLSAMATDQVTSHFSDILGSRLGGGGLSGNPLSGSGSTATATGGGLSGNPLSGSGSTATATGGGFLGKLKSGGSRALSVTKSGLGKFGASFMSGGTAATAVGATSLAAGLAWSAKDGYDGYKRADDIFKDKNKGKKATTSQKVESTISSAVAGDGKGGAKNALKNAGKGALIGAGIGTFVGGPIGTAVGAGIGGAVGAVSGAIGGDKIAKATDTVKDGIVNGVQSLYKGVKHVGGSYIKGIKSYFGGITGGVKSAVSGLYKGSKKILDGDIKGGVKTVFKGMTGGLKKYATAPIKAIKSFASSLIDTDNDNSNSHATGLNYVPHNNYKAVLHEGEAVVNRSQADALRSFGVRPNMKYSDNQGTIKKSDTSNDTFSDKNIVDSIYYLCDKLSSLIEENNKINNNILNSILKNKNSINMKNYSVYNKDILAMKNYT